MQDVSGFGFVLSVIASNTFPVGFPVTAFADDADAMDVPELTIVDTAMGLNGDLISWSKAEPIKPKIAVIQGSVDDVNLSILLNANRVGRGKLSAFDVITITGVFPSGATITFSQGKITKGMISASVASSGRLKTKTFEFSFENVFKSGF